ncbi:T9SS type A sorting domain-containing protein [Croceimicrobium hydrocarbonivorans]|uniref:T9SS type A sorting domain-containing protein n=1 Tax=Croceimicrobium hydrocarbonivorans TaxID=2761580 RepID=A0A7H0VCL9_9FLAO|nr:T9SS type A sorting domain-containing protein [Croceimicrobium hydrocarbonivorans]QNR23467.1 T9SS type A sorting domain-containing protein [Croceimicrobium hydrocarbonivorans]
MKLRVFHIVKAIILLLVFSTSLSYGQWNTNVAILHLHDSTYSVKSEPFQINTYGDSGVCIFGGAIYDGLIYAGSRAIEAEINPVDGSYLRSSSPRKLSQSNDSYSSVSFSFPNQNRVLVRNRYSTSAVQIDSVSLRVTSSDSVLAIYGGDWSVIEYEGAQASSEVWLRKNGDGLICKKIDLVDASELQYLDLEKHLHDSLFDAKNPSYSLKKVLIDGSNIVLEFIRFDNSILDPITGLPYLEQATLSIDTVSLAITNSKYAKVPYKSGNVVTSKEGDRVLYVDETSVRDMTDTSMRKNVFLYNYADSSSVSISFKSKFYINILGYEIIFGSGIYTQNGYYLMFSPTINFPPNGINVYGVRFALFDSTGQVLYDVQTNNEWVPLYFNQVKIPKRGEVYFNIQEHRPADNIILGKIDLAGNNPLFVKSPLSRNELSIDNSQISLFPNPASSYVEVASDTAMEELRIVNCLGQLVYYSEVKGKNHLIATREFAKGVYTVTVRTDRGSVSTSKLLIN